MFRRGNFMFFKAYMKKALAILLLIIYSSTAFGTVVNFHYCGKSLEKISLLNFGNRNTCPCDTGNTPMDCCKNVIHYFKTGKHTSTQTELIPNITFSLAEPPSFIVIEMAVKNGNCNRATPYYFRRCSPQPIYLLNSIFRI